ncbi:MAG: tetratricopeptide repeat protein [Treponema sp.]|nr:tetratricopeptide repeat protein [Treponema sp.]
MKKVWTLLIYVALIAALTMPVAAQTNILRTAHYELVAEAGAESALSSLANELEQRFNVYNQLFRFDASSLPSGLKVRVFTNTATYDAYVRDRIGIVSRGAVYLHYNNYDRRELVILKGSPEEAAMLAHQSFIQFLRGFIPNPPAWMREGFSIYFNSLKYDPEEQALLYEENMAWLETVKSLGNNLIYPRDILMADNAVYGGVAVDTFSRNFQICSWAFVSFLLYSGNHYRTLIESFMLLSPQGSAEENGMAVMNRFSLWTDFSAFNREYTAYIDSRKTFTELMEDGRRFYDLGNAMMAELSFLAAQDQRPAHYAPYYYLGLIYYEEKLYEMAEEYYRLSLECGADEALVSYALGINAASAGRNDDAIAWLTRAATVDPGRYGTRAEDLIQRLR